MRGPAVVGHEAVAEKRSSLRPYGISGNVPVHPTSGIIGRKAYMLNLAPAVAAPAPQKFRLDRMLLGLACMITAGALFFFVWKRWHTLDEIHGPSPAVASGEKASPAIFLFGEFEVTDKDGNDRTYLFTPPLKELFLLLLIHTEKDGKGIAAERLFELLWGGKSPADAQKDFNLNLVKLKDILKKTGNLEIVEGAGRWKLEVPADVRFDYRDYLRQTAGRPSAPVPREITSRGGFLQNEPYEWLNSIKSEISTQAPE